MASLWTQYLTVRHTPLLTPDQVQDMLQPLEMRFLAVLEHKSTWTDKYRELMMRNLDGAISWVELGDALIDKIEDVFLLHKKGQKICEEAERRACHGMRSQASKSPPTSEGKVLSPRSKSEVVGKPGIYMSTPHTVDIQQDIRARPVDYARHFDKVGGLELAETQSSSKRLRKDAQEPVKFESEPGDIKLNLSVLIGHLAAGDILRGESDPLVDALDGLTLRWDEEPEDDDE